MQRLAPLGRCARGNQTLVARPREAQWMRSAHLRVRIIFDRSVVTALMRERRLDHTLYYMRPELKTIHDLAGKLCHDFSLSCHLQQLHFSLEGFTIPFQSPCQILKPDDVLHVGLLEGKALLLTPPTTDYEPYCKPQPLLSDPVKSSKTEQQTTRAVPEHHRKRKFALSNSRSSHLNKKAAKGSGLSGFSLQKARTPCGTATQTTRPCVKGDFECREPQKRVHMRFHSSGDEGSIDKESSSVDSDDTSSSQSPSSKSSSVGTSSADTSGSTADSSDTSAGENDGLQSKRKEISKSSSSGTKGGSHPRQVDCLVKGSSWDSMSVPVDAWQHQAADLPLYQQEPSVGDVLAYKILEVAHNWQPQVSEFRHGKVISYDSQEESVVIAPWPHAGRHPDPYIQGQKDFEQDRTNEDSDEGILLTPPQSEYNDDGTLKKKLSDFVEIRLVCSSEGVQDQLPVALKCGPSSLKNPVKTVSPEPSGLANGAGQVSSSVPMSQSPKGKHRRKQKRSVVEKPREVMAVHGEKVTKDSISAAWIDFTEQRIGATVVSESDLAQLAKELEDRKVELKKCKQRSGNCQGKKSLQMVDNEGSMPNVVPKPCGWRASAVGPLWTYLQQQQAQGNDVLDGCE